MNAKSPYSNAYNSFSNTNNNNKNDNNNNNNNGQSFVKEKTNKNIQEKNNRKFSEREYREEEYNEEEDPEWLEIDVKEIERNKINFQALPEKSETENNKDKVKDKENLEINEENKNLSALNKSDDVESKDDEDALNRLGKIYDNNNNPSNIKIEKINLFNDQDISLDKKDEENILDTEIKKFSSMDVNDIFNYFEKNTNENNLISKNDNTSINPIFADNLFSTEKNETNLKNKIQNLIFDKEEFEDSNDEKK